MVKRTIVKRIPVELDLEINNISLFTGLDKYNSGRYVAEIVKRQKEIMKGKNKDVWDYFKF